MSVQISKRSGLIALLYEQCKPHTRMTIFTKEDNQPIEISCNILKFYLNEHKLIVTHARKEDEPFKLTENTEYVAQVPCEHGLLRFVIKLMETRFFPAENFFQLSPHIVQINKRAHPRVTVFGKGSITCKNRNLSDL